MCINPYGPRPSRRGPFLFCPLFCRFLSRQQASRALWYTRVALDETGAGIAGKDFGEIRGLWPETAIAFSTAELCNWL